MSIRRRITGVMVRDLEFAGLGSDLGGGGAGFLMEVIQRGEGTRWRGDPRVLVGLEMQMQTSNAERRTLNVE